MNELATSRIPFKNISGVSIIFDWGMGARGNSSGPYAQADIVDLYGYRVNEELEYENVRTHYVDTRRSGCETDLKRLAEVPAGFVPVFLSLDWHPGAEEKSARKHNASIVEFSGDLYPLANRLCEALTAWGQNYVWGHRVSRPVAVEGEAAFVRIKPFALNGPHAEEYIKRLSNLGEELGRAFGEFCRGKGQGLRNL